MTKKKENTKKKEDNRVLMNLKKSRRAFFLEYGCAIFLISLFIFLYVKDVKINPFLTYFMVGLTVFSVGSAEISRLVHRCKITPSKIVIINGLIGQSKKHIYLSGISDVDVRQGILARLLNYGKIHIKSMSGESSLEIKDVSNPGKKMERIENIIERYKNE